MRLKGKVAVITGGASGLGEQIAKKFAAEGAAVVITDIDLEKGKKVVQEIKDTAAEASFFHHNVSSEEAWQTVLEETAALYSGIDILVNNAGINIRENIEDCSFENWKKIIDVNLNSVFLGCKHVLPFMKNSGSGSIINISSIQGIVGNPHMPAYNATKGAVRLLTKSVALHCAKEKYGIRANSIHPGYIESPLVNSLSEEKQDYYKNLHPVGHFGEGEDIAQGAVYLASEDSKFVTGTELIIDGGYTAQ